MSLNLDNLPPNSDYNILLLGEHSSGKSTLVNAFANYAKFSSFDEAIREGSELEQLIPTRAIQDPKTKNFTTQIDPTVSPKVHTLRLSNKIIRFVDTPGFVLQNSTNQSCIGKYFDKISQCLKQHPKLHAILQVTNHHLSAEELFLIQMLHQSARNNLIFCYTKNEIYKHSDEPTFQNLKSNIQTNLDIQLKMGQNLITIDNEAYQHLVLHKCCKQTNDQTKMDQLKSGWKQASTQIQSMLNYISSQKPYEWKNSFVLIKSAQIINLSQDILSNEEEKSDTIHKLEEICFKLYKIMISSSFVFHDGGFKQLIHYQRNIFNQKNQNSVKFHDKLENILKENYGTYSESQDFIKLFAELRSLEHFGSYFDEKLDKMMPKIIKDEEFSESIETKAKIDQNASQLQPKSEIFTHKTEIEQLVQLQHVLSLVTENNLLLIEMKNGSTGKCIDLSNASLQNVVFTCDKSSTEMRDFIITNTTNVSTSDAEFIVENLDRLIKQNFDNLLPVIKNYPLYNITSERPSASLMQHILHYIAGTHLSTIRKFRWFWQSYQDN